MNGVVCAMQMKADMLSGQTRYRRAFVVVADDEPFSDEYLESYRYVPAHAQGHDQFMAEARARCRSTYDYSLEFA